MIQIDFSEEEIDQLNYERYHYPRPLVQKRMEALYLKSQKLSHQKICQICQISKTTLIVYLKKYQEGGKESLKKLVYELPNRSKLRGITSLRLSHFVVRLHSTAPVRKLFLQIAASCGVCIPQN